MSSGLADRLTEIKHAEKNAERGTKWSLRVCIPFRNVLRVLEDIFS